MKLELLESDKAKDKKYRAAVAIIRYRDTWLLGLAQNTGDDRENKWTFVAGGTKPGEGPRQTAVREAKEEAGISVTAVADFEDSSKKDVIFVVCKASSGAKLRPNHEFAHMAFFTTKQMKSLDLYRNVENHISQAKRRC